MIRWRAMIVISGMVHDRANTVDTGPLGELGVALVSKWRARSRSVLRGCALESREARSEIAMTRARYANLRRPAPVDTPAIGGDASIKR